MKALTNIIGTRSARPNIPQTMQSRSVLLKNMFNPEEYVHDYDRQLSY